MGNIEIGLVEGKGFDQFGELSKDQSDPRRFLSVEIKAYRQEDQVRAKITSFEGRHRRATTELASLVVAGRQNSSPAASPDCDGFSGQFGLLSDLDRRIKAIHIDMDDFALRFVL